MYKKPNKFLAGGWSIFVSVCRKFAAQSILSERAAAGRLQIKQSVYKGLTTDEQWQNYLAWRISLRVPVLEKRANKFLSRLKNILNRASYCRNCRDCMIEYPHGVLFSQPGTRNRLAGRQKTTLILFALQQKCVGESSKATSLLLLTQKNNFRNCCRARVEFR